MAVKKAETTSKKTAATKTKTKAQKVAAKSKAKPKAKYVSKQSHVEVDSVSKTIILPNGVAKPFGKNMGDGMATHVGSDVATRLHPDWCKAVLAALVKLGATSKAKTASTTDIADLIPATVGTDTSKTNDYIVRWSSYRLAKDGNTGVVPNAHGRAYGHYITAKGKTLLGTL